MEKMERQINYYHFHSCGYVLKCIRFGKFISLRKTAGTPASKCQKLQRRNAPEAKDDVIVNRNAGYGYDIQCEVV